MMGKELHAARRAIRMTQSHLAGAAGVSARTVRRAEAGEEISDENLRALCSVLNLAVTPMAKPSHHGNILVMPSATLDSMPTYTQPAVAPVSSLAYLRGVSTELADFGLGAILLIGMMLCILSSTLMTVMMLKVGAYQAMAMGILNLAVAMLLFIFCLDGPEKQGMALVRFKVALAAGLVPANLLAMQIHGGDLGSPGVQLFAVIVTWTSACVSLGVLGRSWRQATASA